VPVRQDLRESIHAIVGRAFVRNSRRRVERDQVHLGFDPRQQFHEASGIVWRVVDAGEQHVLERDPVPVLERKAAAGVDDAVQRIFPIGRDELGPLFVGRRVQRNGQVRHQRLACELLEAGDDADG